MINPEKSEQEPQLLESLLINRKVSWTEEAVKHQNLIISFIIGVLLAGSIGVIIYLYIL